MKSLVLVLVAASLASCDSARIGADDASVPGHDVVVQIPWDRDSGQEPDAWTPVPIDSGPGTGDAEEHDQGLDQGAETLADSGDTDTGPVEPDLGVEDAGLVVDSGPDAAVLGCEPDGLIRCVADAECQCGWTCCDGICTDPTRDVFNCGSCGNACPLTQASKCEASECRCGSNPMCGGGLDAVCCRGNPFGPDPLSASCAETCDEGS